MFIKLLFLLEILVFFIVEEYKFKNFCLLIEGREVGIGVGIIMLLMFGKDIRVV